MQPQDTPTATLEELIRIIHASGYEIALHVRKYETSATCSKALTGYGEYHYVSEGSSGKDAHSALSTAYHKAATAADAVLAKLPTLEPSVRDTALRKIGRYLGGDGGIGDAAGLVDALKVLLKEDDDANH